MKTGFSASYSRLNGTTGYTPNSGVWTKNQMKQEKQLQQQQQQQQQKQQQQQWKPVGRKRKKWTKELQADPNIYQISELDEREDTGHVSLPALVGTEQHKVTDGLVDNNDDNNDDENVESEDKSQIPQIIVTVEPPPDIPQENSNFIPNITQNGNSSFLRLPDLRSCSPVFCKSNYQIAAIRSNNENNTNVQNLPVDNKLLEDHKNLVNNYNGVFIREDTGLLRVKKSQSLKAEDSSRFLESPKYTHLHVPKHDTRVTHVSQESADSPFMLPKIRALKSRRQKRKPVMVSLSQNIAKAKASVRKRWNLQSLNEPFTFRSISPESVSTRATVESRDSSLSAGKWSGKGYVILSTSLEDLRSKSYRDIYCDNVDNGNTARDDDFTVNEEVNEDLKDVNNDCNKENDRITGNNVDSGSQRKKWVHPDCWPSQNSTHGEYMCWMKIFLDDSVSPFSLA
ncbi:hypothetical protein ACF0H5_000257 [Mactra antiquata]